MNSRLEQRIGALVGAGSFWYKNMRKGDQVPLVRSLTRMSAGTGSLSSLRRAANLAAGEAEATAQNLTWTFLPDEVVVLGPDLNDRVVATAKDPDGVVMTAISRPPGARTGLTPLFAEQDPASMSPLSTEAGDFLLWPVSAEVPDDGVTSILWLRPVYLLPVPRNHTPVAIATEGRDLVLGLNYLAADGFLTFFEPPMELFPRGTISVRASWERLETLHDYVWAVDL